MDTPALINADPSWPMRCPPILSGDLSRLNEKRVNEMIEDWLERALRESMPESVLSFFFTELRSIDSKLQTDTRMIVRGGEEQSRLVGRFAWMIAYNIKHGSSLLQRMHRCDGEVGRSAIVLSADSPAENFQTAPHSLLAYLTLEAGDHPPSPLDESKMAFDGWRVPIREEARAAEISTEHAVIPSAEVRLFGDDTITPELLAIAVSGVVSSDDPAPGYRAHVWPLLETVQVLMVMAPAFSTIGEHRINLGGCGLNLLIQRNQVIAPEIIETALKIARKLDSLFGTVQHLYQMQTRGKMTHEALNTIAHSLKNRADRLSAMFPECARDLYIQKLAAQGAGQLSNAPSKVFFAEDGAQLWRRAGFSRESITESLLKTVWKSHPQLRLSLSPLEDRIADARWVTLIEELMENLAKWNASSAPGLLTLQQNEDTGFATLTVTGTVRPGQWRGIENKVSTMCGAEEQVQFKGLNTVLAMLHRLVDHSRGASVRYDAGARDASTEPIPAKEYDFDGLPITLHQHESFPTVGTPLLPLTLTVQHLPLPPYD